LIFLATFVFAIAILYWGQTVLIPVAFSLLLTFLLSPIVDGLERLRLGRVPSVILVVVLAFSLLAAMGWIITRHITNLAGELPRYERNIKQKVVDLRQMGNGGTIGQVQKTVDEIKDEMEKGEEPRKAKQQPREVVLEAERPGGLVQARYLCKRLVALSPSVKIVVGRWSGAGELDDSDDSLCRPEQIRSEAVYNRRATNF
jgi:AI-2E family transporter